MLKSLQNPLSLASRLLLAYVFVPQGIAKITGFAGTVGYITSVGMPAPTLAAAFAILFEVVGGLALLLGLGTRWAALALAVFTAVASVFFHAYWSLPADQQFMQMLMFNKNLGIIGGLLALAAFGAGGWALDAKVGGQERLTARTA